MRLILRNPNYFMRGFTAKLIKCKINEDQTVRPADRMPTRTSDPAKLLFLSNNSSRQCQYANCHANHNTRPSRPVVLQRATHHPVVPAHIINYQAFCCLLTPMMIPILRLTAMMKRGSVHSTH